ncbi:MAG: hypothetical protein QOF32_2295 [Gammaproteobacteria bacterium]|nr:hypothetical protein [Gammaproteobacteria bacterium]
MNESLAIEGDADMQFLVREMHEDKITLMHLAASDRLADAELFQRGTRHMNACTPRRIFDQSAAVEPARRGAAESIRLAEHGFGEVDHEDPWIRGARDAG